MDDEERIRRIVSEVLQKEKNDLVRNRADFVSRYKVIRNTG